MTAPATTTPTAPPLVAPFYTKRKRLEQLHTQLVSERTSFIAHWKSINKVLFPTRGRFTLSDGNKGDRRNKDIIDATATSAASTLASGMMTSITSPARAWFRLTTPDPDLNELASVKDWLHQSTEELLSIIAKSNFYDTIHMVYGDLGAYGTSPFLVDEDAEKVIRCLHVPIGQYCLSNDHYGRVRTFTREFKMTVRQLVMRFGFAKCSSAVQNAWQAGRLEQWFDIVHVITPNDDYNATWLSAKYKPFLSCYFEKAQNEADQLLGESGYDEFPIFTARWDVTAEDVYATACPGMTALGDINQLQLGEKKSLQAIEKHVNPPLVAHPDLRREPVTQLPGGVTYDGHPANNGGLRPLHEVKPDVDKLEMKQAQVRERINKAFFVDVFLMTSYLTELGGKQPRSAAEIAVREQEKLMVLGPMVNRLDNSVFDPFIDRVFRIAFERGRIPHAPPELEGMELKVEYISIMHAAQKAAGLGQMERFLVFARSVAETAAVDRAGVLDKVDIDQSIDEYAAMAGVPPRVVRPDEDVAAIRQQREQAAAEQRQAETLKNAAAGAKNLSETDTEGPNALTELLSMAGTQARPE